MKKIHKLIIFVLLLIPFFALLLVYVLNTSSGDNEAVIVDDRPLEIEVTNPVREIINPYTEITVKSNKEIKLKETNRTKLTYIDYFENKYYYVARVNNIGIGEINIKLELSDEIGNTKVEEVAITRKTFNFPAGYYEISPWEDSSYLIQIDLPSTEVNKEHRLFEDYEPDDLVDLNEEFGILTLNNAMLRADAARALNLMLTNLYSETGAQVTVASGYRSYETQITTYASWVRQYGETEANKFSAKPGHSQHQLGTTVDFVSEETGWKIDNSFGDTVAGKWLRDNADKYGFIVPYFEDQSESGGYQEESWHFRYIPE